MEVLLAAKQSSGPQQARQRDWPPTSEDRRAGWPQLPPGRCHRRVLVWLYFAASAALLWQQPLQAQNLLSAEPTGTEYPAREYYLGLQAYRSGDLDAASQLFDAALRNVRRDVHGRWIDSIPSLAMLAECHWQLGSLPTAREHLDHALQIAHRSRGWFSRVDWQSIANPGVQPRPQYLWPAAAGGAPLPLKQRIAYHGGEPLTEARLARGGVIEEPSVRSIDVIEIMRGLSLAAYRRRIVLGPLSENEPLAIRLLESTKEPAGLQLPVPRSLIGCLQAAGYFASGDDPRAISTAASVATPSGSAHPLSAIAMLTHGSAVAGSDQAAAAIPGLLSIVHIAGALEQPELIGEALQLAAGCVNSQTAMEVVNVAQLVSASLTRVSPLAVLHGSIAGADAAVTAGDLRLANEMLAQAQAIASRREVSLPRLEAYSAYVAARIAAASGSSIGIGKTTAVDQALLQVSQFALHHRFRNQPLVSMPRVYQLNLVQQAIGNTVGNKTGDALLVSYCHDSPIQLWRRDPVDAIAGILVDRSALHVARVNLAASQGYGEAMLTATDAMLSDRFNSRLRLAGRLSTIRFLARSDDSLLENDAIKMRDAAGPLMQDLRALVAAMGPPTPPQIEILESKASQLGLSRNVFPQVMPPRLKDKLPIARLPKRTGLLTFAQVGNDKMYGMLAIDGKVEIWNIAGAARVGSEVGRLLREIGVGKTRGNRLPSDASWRKAAMALRQHLIPEDHLPAADRMDELIVVPDGAPWYAPFDLLPTDDENSALLGDRVTIRFASTPGFALQRISKLDPNGRIGIVAGPFLRPKMAH